MPTRKLVVDYQQDLALLPDRWQQAGAVLIYAVLMVFPTLASDYWLSISLDTMVAVVGSVAIMVLTGFAGQVSLGHAAFIGVGAYAAAIFGSIYGLPFWLNIPMAGVIATCIGLTVGPFALRLEGLYLAIVTVGLLFLVQHVIKQGIEPLYQRDSFVASMHVWFVAEGTARGGLGAFFEDSTYFGLTVSFKQKLYLVFLVLTSLVVWLSWNIQHSRLGRSMMAVRDRDVTAAVIGVNPARVKFVAFGISSFLAGVAGAMYAYAHPTVSLDSTGAPFSLTMSVLYLAMVVLGGIGTTFGAVLGAVSLSVLFPLAEKLAHLFPFPASFSGEQQGALIFFPVLCLFLVFEPLGILGIWLRIKRYFLAWPFRY